MISAEMGIGESFAAKAIEVLVPSWGEINVSLVAALSVLLLAGYLHQQANMPKEEEEDHEETTTNPERKGQDILATTPPSLELENDDNDTVKASAAGSTISGVNIKKPQQILNAPSLNISLPEFEEDN
jgi:hypothetical protein